MQTAQKLLALGYLFSVSLTPAKAIGSKHTASLSAALVSVSSANYANSPRADIQRAADGKVQVNPTSPPLIKLNQPQRFVFFPGETYETEISYEEICDRLSVALAQKGFVNATDQQGRVQDPTNVDLILRVHSGERPWRNPIVREDQLTWREGLVPRSVGRSLTTLGGEIAWESRAGGNDDTFAAAAANANAPTMGGGRQALSPTTAANSAQTTSRNEIGEYDSTQDFYFIVVDAFSYQDIMKKGNHAKRLWTTFIAAPRQRNQKFSDVLNAMLRVGTPYFGETTSGLEMFNDARASISYGPTEVIESDVKLPPEPKF